jgi:hypothetical protein
MTDRRYNFVIPPGWLRLDLRGELEPEVRRFADVLLVDAPRDRVAAARAALVRQITSLASAAKADGVLDLVLPVMSVDGSTANASFAVTAFDTADLDPVDVIAGIASTDASATLIEVADLVALRTEEAVASDPDAVRATVIEMATDAGAATDSPGTPEPVLPELVSRRVRHYLGHPERPDDWIIAMLSVMQADTESSRNLSQTMVDLFDQVVLTMRFEQ